MESAATAPEGGSRVPARRPLPPHEGRYRSYLAPPPLPIACIAGRCADVKNDARPSSPVSSSSSSSAPQPRLNEASSAPRGAFPRAGARLFSRASLDLETRRRLRIETVIDRIKTFNRFPKLFHHYWPSIRHDILLVT